MTNRLWWENVSVTVRVWLQTVCVWCQWSIKYLRPVLYIWNTSFMAYPAYIQSKYWYSKSQCCRKIYSCPKAEECLHFSIVFRPCRCHYVKCCSSHWVTNVEYLSNSSCCQNVIDYCWIVVITKFMNTVKNNTNYILWQITFLFNTVAIYILTMCLYNFVILNTSNNNKNNNIVTPLCNQGEPWNL